MKYEITDPNGIRVVDRQEFIRISQYMKPPVQENWLINIEKTPGVTTARLQFLDKSPL